MNYVVKLYLQSKWTYVLQNKATIKHIARDASGMFVRLNQTIFHPQGGGQPFDTGKMGKFNVVAVQHAENKTEVNHYLAVGDNEAIDLKVGDEVDCCVDIERRAQNVVLHTTGHFIANVLETLNLKNPNGHHVPGQAKLQLNMIMKNQRKKL